MKATVIKFSEDSKMSTTFYSNLQTEITFQQPYKSSQQQCYSSYHELFSPTTNTLFVNFKQTVANVRSSVTPNRTNPSTEMT